MDQRSFVESPVSRVTQALPAEPAGVRAIRLWERARGRTSPLIYVTASSSDADRLAQILHGLDSALRFAHLPPWDALPYDRASPSRSAMGRRAGVFRWLTNAKDRPPLIVTSPRALLQRVPPPDVWRDAHLELCTGEEISPDALASRLDAIGYVAAEQAEEPGTYAIGGQVIDIFPAAAPNPCRVEIADGRIAEIRSFDAASQRSLVETNCLTVDPASEVLRSSDAETPARRTRGMEHRLSEFYPRLCTLFDYAPDAKIICEPDVAARVDDLFEQIADAYESEKALSLAQKRQMRAPPEPARLYLDAQEWQAILATHALAKTTKNARGTKVDALPDLAAQGRDLSRFATFCERFLDTGRIVLAVADPRLTARLLRAQPDLRRRMTDAKTWADVLALSPGSIAALPLALDHGFTLGDTAIVTAQDVFGREARARESASSVMPRTSLFAPGCLAIHIDHGVGRIVGLETLEDSASGLKQDLLCLQFDGSRLMVPVRDMWKVWPYEGEADAVALDELNSASWAERRRKLEADIALSAGHLRDVATTRRRTKAPRLVPPAVPYERFTQRFAFLPTPDQSAAIDDVMRDLASGRPMDRLVCGDVGYGKTEVALHAIAAAALSGKQVALVAPTTVLARQHLATVRRRFRGLGVKIGHLSRLAGPSETRQTREALAAGEIDILVGTHAVLSRHVTFSDLALVIVDEEQRFGAAQKKALHQLSDGLHRLSMTATPIPRTLQTALIGLRDLSLLTTPPAVRTPIRTLMVSADDDMLRHALQHEWDRDGQSFVVCPRIEDIPALQARLEKIVPDLSLCVIHGKMPPAEVDETLMRFADGDGDVLLATNIIESGLDIPNANTLLVWRPDRFGLAQLHQLRGRVGRGTRRGILYLLRDDAEQMAESSELRLAVLESLDRLGAGFEISARDLARRGAGDLVGDEQAGHMKLIGAQLYQHMLTNALRDADDDAAQGGDWMPDLRTGIPAYIPESYVPEAELRLTLYHRLGFLRDGEEVRDLEAELDDRFGPLPDEAVQLLRQTELAILCRRNRICKLDIGPAAVAVTIMQPIEAALGKKLLDVGFEKSNDRYVSRRESKNLKARQSLVYDLARQLEG